MLSSFLDGMLPQNCCICGAPGGKSLVCGACRTTLPYWRREQACPVCAQQTASGELCGQCLSEAPSFDHVEAVFEYAFPVNRLIPALKYRQRLALARYFSAVMAACTDSAEMSAADVIVPMPLHKARLRQRGFNQAVELARPLGRRLALPLELRGIIRHKAVPPQEGLSRRERRDNVRGVFRCRDGFARQIEGGTILVVDDVMTTGATLDALARTLKRAGACRVNGLVLARTMNFR